jgi:hypothetical protein
MTPVLSSATLSISVSSWFSAPRVPALSRWLRFCPIASTSSKNTTQGALRRARANTSWTLCSLLPMYMSSTSASETAMKCAPSSPATARAMNVLPQPGGP